MEDETRGNNAVLLRGVVSEKPFFSHESRGEAFYQFSLDVARLSGNVDRIHILARSTLLDELLIGGASKLRVEGELRSFNNKSGAGPKLVISVLARALRFEDGPDENEVLLRGTLCKPPTHRITPMGREICDLMLAVGRHYGRSDYLPCIAWGHSARKAGSWNTGTALRLRGRIQSRKYNKLIDGATVEKVAYEVSVLQLSGEQEA